MAIQFSVAVRNAQGNAIEATIGTSPTLEIRSGAPPANCAADDDGTVLATVALPSDWLEAFDAGSADFLGTWEDTSADATGTAGHFRVKQVATCHMQGTCGTSAADMIFVTTALTAGQPFEVTSFTLTIGNA